MKLSDAELTAIEITTVSVKNNTDIPHYFVETLLAIIQKQAERIEDLENTVADMEDRGGLRMRRPVG